MHDKPVLNQIAVHLEPLIDRTEIQLESIQSQLASQEIASLREQGFAELTAAKVYDGDVEPERCWHRPFTWAEVHKGFPIDREWPAKAEHGTRTSITETLLTKLENGNQCILLGKSGAGKTTLSKIVAYRWFRENETGPVFYRRSGTGNPLTNPEYIRHAIETGREHGDVLVVVEDATRTGTLPIFELVDEYDASDDVVFLLNARKHDWEQIDSTLQNSEYIDGRSTAGRQLVDTIQQTVSEVHIPDPDSQELQRLFTRFKEITGRTIDHSPEELLESLSTGAGVSPLLLATYYLPRQSTDTPEFGYDANPIARDVAQTYRELQAIQPRDGPSAVTHELLSRVAVLINALNAADIGVQKEHPHALATTKEDHAAIDWILDAFDGLLLFGIDENGEYYVPHHHWSVTRCNRRLIQYSKSCRSAA